MKERNKAEEEEKEEGEEGKEILNVNNIYIYIYIGMFNSSAI